MKANDRSSGTGSYKKRSAPANAKSAKASSSKKSVASPSKNASSTMGQPQYPTVVSRKSPGDVDTSKMKSSGVQTARKATLDEWFEAIRSHAASTAESGAPTGACLVPDPNGGPSFCVEMTQEACTSPAVKGTWVGGNC